jgi:hypothetical protein
MRYLLTSFARAACVLFLVTGVLVPKMSAALVALMPGFQAMVICTGTELVTIVLAPDGSPIEVSKTDTAPCTMADASDPGTRPFPFWIALALANIVPPAVLENSAWARDRLANLKLQRGPPVLV